MGAWRKRPGNLCVKTTVCAQAAWVRSQAPFDEREQVFSATLKNNLESRIVKRHSTGLKSWVGEPVNSCHWQVQAVCEMQGSSCGLAVAACGVDCGSRWPGAARRTPAGASGVLPAACGLGQQQGIGTDFFAVCALEHGQQIRDIHAGACFARNVQHDLTLVQHDGARAVV